MTDSNARSAGRRGARSLADGDIATTHGVGRRSLLSMLGGLGVTGSAVVVTGCQAVPGPVIGTGCTDADTGAYADLAGRGRRCGGSGSCTDADTGAYADPVGRGRRCGYTTGCTDADTGAYADPAGYGRRC